MSGHSEAAELELREAEHPAAHLRLRPRGVGFSGVLRGRCGETGVKREVSHREMLHVRFRRARVTLRRMVCASRSTRRGRHLCCELADVGRTTSHRRSLPQWARIKQCQRFQQTGQDNEVNEKWREKCMKSSDACNAQVKRKCEPTSPI